MRDSDKRSARNRILDVLRSVRWRWRARIILRGLVWVAALTGAVVFLSALGLERMRFSAEAVIWLSSDRASFVTGHLMHADGGVLIKSHML